MKRIYYLTASIAAAAALVLPLFIPQVPAEAQSNEQLTQAPTANDFNNQQAQNTPEGNDVNEPQPNEAEVENDQAEVEQIIADRAEVQAKRRALIVNRTDAEVLRDSDGDGITDFDEINLYGTNPNEAISNPDTNEVNVGQTDSQKILSGINPVTNETIQYEDPRVSAEDLVIQYYTVDTIQAQTKDDPVNDVTTVESVTFAGVAAKNSFVTLHIFSVPVVVTVKSDSNGLWRYQLDRQLENGDHEVFVTTVDNSGKILARSPSIPFVKTANAAGFADDLQAAVLSDTGAGSGFFSLPILLVAVAVFVIFVLGAITLAGSAASGVKGPGKPGNGAYGDDGAGDGRVGDENGDIADDGVSVSRRDNDVPPTPRG